VSAKYQSKGPIYILNLLAFAEIIQFFKMYFWERKSGIRNSNGKSAGYGILVKKERNAGLGSPFQTLIQV